MLETMSLQTIESAHVPTAGRRRTVFMRLAMIAFLAVMAFAVFAVTWPKVTAGDMARLQAQPEASMFYPDSILLREGGNEPTPMAVAGIWKQLGTDASTDAVLAFYRPALAALGWETGGGSTVGMATNESQVCSWHNATMIVRISFWKKGDFRKAYPANARFTTAYELRLIDHTSAQNEVPCAIP